MEKLLLTAKEAAAYLNISVSMLYKLMKQGRIECIKIGSSTRFPQSYLEDWVDGQRSDAWTTTKDLS